VGGVRAGLRLKAPEVPEQPGVHRLQTHAGHVPCGVCVVAGTWLVVHRAYAVAHLLILFTRHPRRGLLGSSWHALGFFGWHH
jgi:hypothetical protein